MGSLTAAPEGWQGHLLRRRLLRGSSSPFPHHHELLRRRGPPRAPSSSGNIGLSAWLMTRSRRVAVLRADGIKLHRPIRRFSIFRFSAFLPANHQRLRRTRPSVPAPPGRATPSIYISVASTATILKFRRPTSRSLRRYSVAPSTTLLGGAPLKRRLPFSTNSPVPSGSLRAPDQSVL